MYKVGFVEDIIINGKTYKAHKEYILTKELIFKLIDSNVKIVFLPIAQTVSSYSKKPIIFL